MRVLICFAEKIRGSTMELLLRWNDYGDLEGPQAMAGLVSATIVYVFEKLLGQRYELAQTCFAGKDKNFLPPGAQSQEHYAYQVAAAKLTRDEQLLAST
jgi:hypothetical protein